jgi:hypothetical protein
MDSLFCFINTMMVGMLTSAVYFLTRDIDRLSERVSDLEDDSLVLDDDDDYEEDEEEPEVEPETDAKKHE